MTRVLLIDDDAEQLELRRLVLEQAGMEVHTAECPEAARRLFASDAPSHVVMDLRLPRVEDGLSLIRHLRSESPGVDIVVLSGFPADLDRLPESRMVNTVMKKPVRSKRLIERLAVASVALIGVALIGWQLAQAACFAV